MLFLLSKRETPIHVLFFKLCKIFQFRMTDSGRARNFAANSLNTSKTNYLKGLNVSLGNDPPYQTTTLQVFLSPQALKNLSSSPGQAKSPDNSTVLHMFNNTLLLISEQPTNTS